MTDLEPLKTKIVSRTADLKALLNTVPSVWYDTLGVERLRECVAEGKGFGYEATLIRRNKRKAIAGEDGFAAWTWKERSQFVAKSEQLEAACSDIYGAMLRLEGRK